MADASLIHRLLAAEARQGSATRRRLLLGLVGFATALCVANGHTSLPRMDATSSETADRSSAVVVRTALTQAPIVDILVRGGAQDYALQQAPDGLPTVRLQR